MTQRITKNRQEIKRGMFEIHIAGPRMPYEQAMRIFRDLERQGISKNKFFLDIYNVPEEDGSYFPAGVPPTGHDLENPGLMSTVKVREYDEARKLVLAGMSVLKQHKVEGNFEIERVITESIGDYQVPLRDFPDFQRVHDSPAYESHVIWKGTEKEVPSFKEIIKTMEQECRITPHQIVDFSRDYQAAPTTMISRVATVYQPSRQAALADARKLSLGNLKNKNYVVTEQVCLVGEPKKE